MCTLSFIRSFQVVLVPLGVARRAVGYIQSKRKRERESNCFFHIFTVTSDVLICNGLVFVIMQCNLSPSWTTISAVISDWLQLHPEFDKCRRCIPALVFGVVSLELSWAFLFHICYLVNQYAYKWWSDISRRESFELRPWFSAVVWHATLLSRLCNDFFWSFSYNPDFCRSGMFCNAWMCIEDVNTLCTVCVE